MYKFRTTAEWLFCGSLILQTAIVLTLEISTLVRWGSWVYPSIVQVPASYVAPLNLGILMFACVYLSILGLDATHHKNDVLLLAICVSNSCGFVFSAMEYTNLRDTVHHLPSARDAQMQPLVDLNRNFWAEVKPVQLAVPIITGLCALALWPFAYRLHCQYAWQLYRSIHGNTHMKSRYRAYEIYIVLLKVDFYFIIGFILQYNLIDVHFNEPEYSLTMTLIPVTLIIMATGIYSVRSERKILMICVSVCYLGIIAYLLSRIVILFGNRYGAAKDMMLLFAFSSLFLTTFTLVSMVRCMLNFNRGLKDVLKPADVSSRGSFLSVALSDLPPPSPIHTSYTRLSRMEVD